MGDNRKILFVTKRKVIFINSRQGAWDSVANYIHTHARVALEYDKEYPGFELGIVKYVAVKCGVQKAIKFRVVNCFLKLKAKF